jgi:uncharacterized membrane protein
MIEVLVFTRKGCQLCEDVIDHLFKLAAHYPHKTKLIDIDHDPTLHEIYSEKVPVVEIGSEILEPPIMKEDLENALQKTYSSNSDSKRTSKRKRKAEWSLADLITLWLSKHYLSVFNILVLIYVGLPFLAPVFLRAGAITPAKFVYRTYGLVCHQLSFRSLFIFGEQLIYPREAAGLEHIQSFEQATGIGEGHSPRELLEARFFTGNERVGFKVALCQRDVAIYAAILLFGLIFGISGKKIPGLPWYFWVIFGLVPIGLDGVSQIISQPPFNLLPYRESIPLIRALTGFMFGFTTAWFGYPLVEETMADSRRLLEAKYGKVQNSELNTY